MTQQTFLLLAGAGLLLCLVAVVIDRLNFPQPKFRAKGVRVDPSIGQSRDRTGAHIVNLFDPTDASEPTNAPNDDPFHGHAQRGGDPQNQEPS